jgi:hypothetical protein
VVCTSYTASSPCRVIHFVSRLPPWFFCTSLPKPSLIFHFFSRIYCCLHLLVRTPSYRGIDCPLPHQAVQVPSTCFLPLIYHRSCITSVVPPSRPTRTQDAFFFLDGCFSICSPEAEIPLLADNVFFFFFCVFLPVWVSNVIQKRLLFPFSRWGFTPGASF